MTNTENTETPKSDDVTRTAEENAARWSDEDPRAAHAERFGTVPHREKRYYGPAGNP